MLISKTAINIALHAIEGIVENPLGAWSVKFEERLACKTHQASRCAEGLANVLPRHTLAALSLQLELLQFALDRRQPIADVRSFLTGGGGEYGRMIGQEIMEPSRDLGQGDRRAADRHPIPNGLFVQDLILPAAPFPPFLFSYLLVSYLYFILISLVFNRDIMASVRLAIIVSLALELRVGIV